MHPSAPPFYYDHKKQRVAIWELIIVVIFGIPVMAMYWLFMIMKKLFENIMSIMRG